jgi:glyceraldehyde-3-phosphate dehydrogenase/erythrose-4-phosphate dehydrogenase
MPKFHVHLYPVVCVTVRDVEAESQVEAIKKAEELVDLDKLFAGLGGPHVASTQYADDIDSFLVDEEGDMEHTKFTWYDPEYRPM